MSKDSSADQFKSSAGEVISKQREEALRMLRREGILRDRRQRYWNVEMYEDGGRGTTSFVVKAVVVKMLSPNRLQIDDAVLHVSNANCIIKVERVTKAAIWWDET